MKTEHAPAGPTQHAARFMLVSVVVSASARPEQLERCLAALVVQDFDHTAFEILVCDFAAEERTREQVARWAAGTRGAPQVRYLPVLHAGGRAGARNCGWRAAGGLIVAFTDEDTVPHPDWIEEGWKAMATGPAAASGPLLGPDGAPGTGLGMSRPPDAAEFAIGNCFVRRDALVAIGGFDERFTTAWREGADLHFSLMRVGRVIPAPNALVKHPVRPSMDWADGIRAHRKAAFDALLYKKHPRLYRERIRGQPPWIHYLIVLMLLGVAAGALLGSALLAVGALSGWLGLTATLGLKRFGTRGGGPRALGQAIVASIAIPVVAVCSRLAGAWRYRVIFL